MSNLNDPRVLLALERTLLAWNRSGLGLIAFGFVLERSTVLGSFLNPNGEAHKILLSKVFAVVIVILGIIISLWSVRQYKIALKSLTESEMIEGYRTDLPTFLTMISVLCGCLLIITFFV